MLVFIISRSKIMRGKNMKKYSEDKLQIFFPKGRLGESLISLFPGVFFTIYIYVYI